MQWEVIQNAELHFVVNLFVCLCDPKGPAHAEARPKGNKREEFIQDLYRGPTCICRGFSQKIGIPDLYTITFI